MAKPRKNSSCLHLVARSSSEALDGCRSHLAKGDFVLFLDDGVMHLDLVPGDSAENRLFRSGFMAADLDARGLLAVASAGGAKVVDDSEFAELLRNHDHCLTWK